MIGTYHIIEGDLYNISGRLKEIDPAYFVVRNLAAGRFELHVKNQRGGTLALVLPYGALDERTVRLARKTRCERAADLLREADEHNRRLEGEAVAKANNLCVRGPGHETH